jgi:hypothetical protein
MGTNLHDKDFHAWTIEQASLLKAGKLGEIDLDKKTFPPSCPYSTEELFDVGFYPDES